MIGRHVALNQRGIGLVELGIAAALSVVSVALVVFLVSPYLAAKKVDEELQILPQVIADMQAAVRLETSWASMTSARISQERFLPVDYLTGAAGVFRNRWDGVTTFVPVTVVAALPNGGLQITESNLPNKACLMFMRGMDPMALTAAVNGTQVKVLSAAMNQSAVVSQCQLGANTVEIVVRK